MKFIRVLLFSAVIGLSSPDISAQSVSSPAGTGAEVPGQVRLGSPAPVVYWNRQITVFRSYYENFGPQDRARGAEQRLGLIPVHASQWNIVATETSNAKYSGVIVTINGNFVFFLEKGDVDSESGETLQAASDHAIAELRAMLEARASQESLPLLIKGIAFSLLATLFLITALILLMRGGHKALRRLDKAAAVRLHHLKIGAFDLQPMIDAVNRALTKATIWAAAIVVTYLWLTFVLQRFPYTQPWGLQLRSYLINLFATLASGIVHAIPGIFTVVVIFLMARILARVVDRIFLQVEKGDLDVSWLHPDTARATRRLVRVLIWIFAITVAYPYIPGSSTDAFKGVSVFVGLMVSLGSAGLVNQVMSGLVVIYSRALTPGEFVQVGSDTGTVTEVGMLSTKLVTRKKEEIIIPNAVLVGTRTVNYSRHAATEGGIVGTTVTIGYDAPWRQVHSMLLHAADQTLGVRKEPAPRVIQKSLQDFYVEYELVFNLDDPSDRVLILSELHNHIQDAFNEQGVQIMSPHFVGQPAETVYVPKSQWFVGQETGAAHNGRD